MKRALFALPVFIIMFVIASAQAQGPGMMDEGHHHGMGSAAPSQEDNRMVLKAPPMAKEHQKKMMREHLRSVWEIMTLMSEGKFDAASKKAHAGLGVNESMVKMCGMFGEDFKAMGIAFHESGDRLGDALATKDLSKSIAALGDTLGHCVSCHDTFKH